MPFFKYLFLLLFFFNCGNLSFAQSKEEELANEIFDEVNEYRLDKEKAVLQWSESISKIAEQHSRNMANGKVKFSHAGFNTRSKLIQKAFPQKTLTAENLLFNPLDAVDAVDDWFDSPGHNKNMLGNFTHTGIGVAADRKGRFYVTQIFIR
jgi:uncharacterized protein YkwD